MIANFLKVIGPVAVVAATLTGTAMAKDTQDTTVLRNGPVQDLPAIPAGADIAGHETAAGKGRIVIAQSDEAPAEATPGENSDDTGKPEAARNAPKDKKDEQKTGKSKDSDGKKVAKKDKDKSKKNG